MEGEREMKSWETEELHLYRALFCSGENAERRNMIRRINVTAPRFLCPSLYETIEAEIITYTVVRIQHLELCMSSHGLAYGMERAIHRCF